MTEPAQRTPRRQAPVEAGLLRAARTSIQGHQVCPPSQGPRPALRLSGFLLPRSRHPPRQGSAGSAEQHFWPSETCPPRPVALPPSPCQRVRDALSELRAEPLRTEPRGIRPQYLRIPAAAEGPSDGLGERVLRRLVKKNRRRSLPHALDHTTCPQRNDRCAVRVRFNWSDSEVLFRAKHECGAPLKETGRFVISHVPEKVDGRAGHRLQPIELRAIPRYHSGHPETRRHPYQEVDPLVGNQPS